MAATHLAEGIIPSTTTGAVDEIQIIKNGRALGKKGGGSHLMLESYREKHWVVAHGLAGIVHVLMDMTR
ncbi:hypothetical protein GOBAR_AA27127 [Gossypium barbadense]|uniref:Uncharacterized protein n=1 Tax=Gossypium barbadense TaxID=3634 RepID=A0A2P5WR85_GOSBA|nr:hypothetical protein GOBAR_AA27127 [Gossypium barbadense]